MKNELIQQAAEIFDSFDKWNAFIELYLGRNEIRQYNLMKFRSSMLKYFSTENITTWDFVAVSQDQYRWFIKNYGRESICIMWDLNRLYLWGNPAIVQIERATELLKTPEYNLVTSVFNSIDAAALGGQREYFYGENHRYKFDGIDYIHKPDDERGYLLLSWYAGNNTDQLVKQIAEKVNKFRTQQMTKLITELNEKCKR